MALFGRAERPERRGTPADVLVVGLGNPGAEFEGSRHNLGAATVNELARRHGATLKRSKARATTGEVVIGGHRVALAIPLTYVNLSGEAVAALVRRYGIERPQQVVVVHDELDLPPTVMKVKAGGGLAGHNGLRSIKQHLKTDAFLRVRLGVGKPPGGKERGADHVLRKPARREREEFAVAVQEAADAVELIVTEGVAVAMNRYNRRDADRTEP